MYLQYQEINLPVNCHYCRLIFKRSKGSTVSLDKSLLSNERRLRRIFKSNGLNKLFDLNFRYLTFKVESFVQVLIENHQVFELVLSDKSPERVEFVDNCKLIQTCQLVHHFHVGLRVAKNLLVVGHDILVKCLYGPYPFAFKVFSFLPDLEEMDFCF